MPEPECEEEGGGLEELGDFKKEPQRRIVPQRRQMSKARPGAAPPPGAVAPKPAAPAKVATPTKTAAPAPKPTAAPAPKPTAAPVSKPAPAPAPKPAPAPLAQPRAPPAQSQQQAQPCAPPPAQPQQPQLPQPVSRSMPSMPMASMSMASPMAPMPCPPPSRSITSGAPAPMPMTSMAPPSMHSRPAPKPMMPSRPIMPSKPVPPPKTEREIELEKEIANTKLQLAAQKEKYEKETADKQKDVDHEKERLDQLNAALKQVLSPSDDDLQIEAKEEHPLATIDFVKIPSAMDQKFEKLDEDSALKASIIKLGDGWNKTFQKGLLSNPSTTSLGTEEQETERSKAYDLLDSLTRSGVFPVEDASIHVVLAFTHSFDKSIIDTIVQDNMNPIEKMERSQLIIASTLHDKPVADLVDPEVLQRVETFIPILFK